MIQLIIIILLFNYSIVDSGQEFDERWCGLCFCLSGFNFRSAIMFSKATFYSSRLVRIKMSRMCYGYDLVYLDFKLNILQCSFDFDFEWLILFHQCDFPPPPLEV